MITGNIVAQIEALRTLVNEITPALASAEIFSRTVTDDVNRLSLQKRDLLKEIEALVATIANKKKELGDVIAKTNEEAVKIMAVAKDNVAAAIAEVSGLKSKIEGLKQEVFSLQRQKE